MAGRKGVFGLAGLLVAALLSGPLHSQDATNIQTQETKAKLSSLKVNRGLSSKSWIGVELIAPSF